MVKRGVLFNCREMLGNDRSYITIINYLFTMDITEKEVLEYFKEMGIDDMLIREILINNFELDENVIMQL